METLSFIKNWLINNVDWLQAVSAIVVIGGLPVIFIGWIISILYKVGVKIYFDPKETYHQLPEVNSGRDSFWLHVMVKNKSSFTDIKNAQGFVSSVWGIQNGKKYIYSSFRSQIKLKWAHEKDFNPKDIIKRYKKRLDVCFALDGDKNLYFSTEYYPSGTQRFLPPGEYVFLINLTADNLPHSKSYLLHVFWNGEYTKLKAEPYKKNIVELIFGLTKKEAIQPKQKINQTTTLPPEALD